MRKALMVPGLLLALGLSTVAEAATSASDGRFSCRASAVRVAGNPTLTQLSGDPFEPYVANAEADPCASDGSEPGETALVDEHVGTPGGFPFPASIRVYLAGAYSRTRQTDGWAGEAEAGAASVSVSDHWGDNILRAEALKTDARAVCNGGAPALESDSTVAVVELFAGGDPIKPVDGQEMKIPLEGLGTLWVNYEDRTTGGDGEQITRRAIFFDSDEDATGDVIIGESVAGNHGDPC